MVLGFLGLVLVGGSWLEVLFGDFLGVWVLCGGWYNMLFSGFCCVLVIYLCSGLVVWVS